MGAGPTTTLKADGRWIAVTVSLGLHGIVILALASEPRFGFDRRPPIRANLVFASAPAPPPAPLHEELPVPEPVAESPVPLEQPVPEPAPHSMPPVAETTVTPGAGKEPQQSPAVNLPDQPVAKQEPSDDPDVTPDRRRVDYDELGRRAVRAYLDRIEREPQARRFGGGDLAPTGLSSGGGSPQSVFESGPNSRAVLRPTRARSRLVRRIASICNELTGGFSLLGIIGLCTDGNVRSDLLAAVKPDYLDEVPECKEVGLNAEGQAVVAIGEFGATAAVANIDESGAATALKCRLVHRDEIYDARMAPADPD